MDVLDSVEVEDVADRDVNQVAEQRLGGKSAVAEHPDLDHINAQLFGAHLCDMPAQSSPVKATDKIPPELMEMSWNDQRRKGATQALAELVMGMDKPYELLGLFQKEALGYMLANHQVSYTSSTGDKQEAKQMRDARKVQIAKGKLPALQKELADTWPAMAAKAAEEKASFVEQLREKQQELKKAQDQLAAARSEKADAEKAAEDLRQQVEALQEGQAHAKEPAILQAVVDQADLVREKDFGGIMSGTEKEAVRKLFIRLAHCGYQVEWEHPVGSTKCDLFINGKVAVEVKTSKDLSSGDRDQLRGYMQRLTISHGLLLNFPKPNKAQAPQAEHHEKSTHWIVTELLPSARP